MSTPRRCRPSGKPSVLLRCGARRITEQEILQIRRLLCDFPQWTRQQISLHLCRLWNWRRCDGALNHRTCCDLLRRLERQGHIQLPRPRSKHGRPKPDEVLPEPCAQLPVDLPLHQLVVRPVAIEERKRWCQLMRRHHYLGFRGLVGESLRYVATIGPQWVALLAWGAAALKSRPRDRWIGWSQEIKWRRLHLPANNVRFVILPGIRVRNLASKILAANLRRLSRDWQQRYGHPILLAETFVDPARFRGTCYRAAGWIALGTTRGFARTGSGYSAHGKPKMLLVRPLHPDACKMLRSAFSPPLISEHKPEVPVVDIEMLPLQGEDGLIDVLRRIPDPRKPRGVRHPLVCILAIAACASPAGARSFEAIAEWARELSADALRRLGGKRATAPSEKCFRLTLQRLDAAVFDREICAWLARHNLSVGKGLALDGKTLRGARDGDKPAPHLLGAVLHREGIVVAQQQVADKSNEIPCVQPMLRDVAIEGCVVTADAMHTQKETARFLVEEKKADFVFTVKDNQPTLRQDIADLGLEAFPP